MERPDCSLSCFRVSFLEVRRAFTRAPILALWSILLLLLAAEQATAGYFQYIYYSIYRNNNRTSSCQECDGQYQFKSAERHSAEKPI